MADFGLKCWDSQGNVTLDLSDTVSRLRFQTIAGTNESGSISLPDIVGKSVIGFAQSFAFPDPVLLATTFPHGYHEHDVNVNGSKITWIPKGVSHKPNATSNVLVFIYD